MIESYRGAHAGEDIAILANGESLRAVPWDRLSMPKVGTNKAWTEIIPEYHCNVDCGVMAGAPTLPVLFTPERAVGWPCPELKAGKIEKLKALGGDGALGWSSDLSKGAYFCGVTYLALQVAVYLIQRDARIFIFGLDWKGQHHDSTRPMSVGMPRAHRPPMEMARRVAEDQGIQIFNCNHESACDVFEFDTPDGFA